MALPDQVEIDHLQTRPSSINALYMQEDGSAAVPLAHKGKGHEAKLDMQAAKWGAATLVALQHEGAQAFCEGKYCLHRKTFLGSPICAAFQFGLCTDESHPTAPHAVNRSKIPLHRCDFCLQPGHGSQADITLYRPSKARPKPSYEIPLHLLATHKEAGGCPLKFATLVLGQQHAHCTPIFSPNPWFDPERATWRMQQHSQETGNHPVAKRAPKTPASILRPARQESFKLSDKSWTASDISRGNRPRLLTPRLRLSDIAEDQEYVSIEAQSADESWRLLEGGTPQAQAATAAPASQLGLPLTQPSKKRSALELAGGRMYEASIARYKANKSRRSTNPELQSLLESLSKEDQILFQAGVIDLGTLAEALNRKPTGATMSSLPAISLRPHQLAQQHAEIEIREATLNLHEVKSSGMARAVLSDQQPTQTGSKRLFIEWDGNPRFNVNTMKSVLYAASSGFWRKATNLQGRKSQDGYTLQTTEVNLLFSHCSTVKTVCMSKVFNFNEQKVNTEHGFTSPVAPQAEAKSKSKYTHMYVGARKKWVPCTKLSYQNCTEDKLSIKIGNGRITIRDKVDIFIYEAAAIGILGD